MSWAHPRSRGEHPQRRANLHASMGSSPLARGTQKCPETYGGGWGLIPARAGNTFTHWQRFSVLKAHPRSRGEHVSVAAKVCGDVAGSSPLARGTLTPENWHWDAAGLIPARAGNTGIGSFASGWPWAHPRSRGEHT